MSIYSTEVTDKNKKLEYYETVFPRVNEFYENNYKTVEINKEKANKYDSLVEKIKEKKRYFEEYDELIASSNDNYSDGTVIKRFIDTFQELLEEGEKE